MSTSSISPQFFLKYTFFKKKKEEKNPAFSTSYYIRTSPLVILIEIIQMETIKNNNYTKQLCKAFHLWSAL